MRSFLDGYIVLKNGQLRDDTVFSYETTALFTIFDEYNPFPEKDVRKFSFFGDDYEIVPVRIVEKMGE